MMATRLPTRADLLMVIILLDNDCMRVIELRVVKWGRRGEERRGEEKGGSPKNKHPPRIVKAVFGSSYVKMPVVRGRQIKEHTCQERVSQPFPQSSITKIL
jgi:hypothetical protein